MHENINFPHLGVSLSHVGKSISVFGFDIAFYGILIGLSVLVGFFLVTREAKRTGQDPDVYYNGGIYGVLAGIVGARLYYVIFSWDLYKDNLWQILNLRRGGLAIYGAVIGIVVTVLLYSRLKRLKTSLMLDTICIGLVNGQMVGRWGNFFNREAFGAYTDSLFAMQLPLDAVRSSDVTEEMLEKQVVIKGVNYIQAHPTFLYESLWCMALLIVLVLMRKHKKFDGELFLIYVLGYGAGRVWIEALRTDQLLIPGTRVAVSQLLAAATSLICAALLVYFGRKAKDFPRGDRTTTTDS